MQKDGASEAALMVKNPPANAGDIIRDAGSIPGSGRSAGGEHSNPLQYSYLENSTDRGAWQAAVRGVTESRTGLSQLSLSPSCMGFVPAAWVDQDCGQPTVACSLMGLAEL